jgi:hypothetical protein
MISTHLDTCLFFGSMRTSGKPIECSWFDTPKNWPNDIEPYSLESVFFLQSGGVRKRGIPQEPQELLHRWNFLFQFSARNLCQASTSKNIFPEILRNSWVVNTVWSKSVVHVCVGFPCLHIFHREISDNQAEIHLVLNVLSRWVDRNTEEFNAQNLPRKIKEIYLRENEYFALYLRIPTIWVLSILRSRDATAWVEHPVYRTAAPVSVSSLRPAFFWSFPCRLLIARVCSKWKIHWVRPFSPFWQGAPGSHCLAITVTCWNCADVSCKQWCSMLWPHRNAAANSSLGGLAEASFFNRAIPSTILCLSLNPESSLYFSVRFRCQAEGSHSKSAGLGSCNLGDITAINSIILSLHIIIRLIQILLRYTTHFPGCTLRQSWTSRRTMFLSFCGCSARLGICGLPTE